jgi:hypothetical protein
MQRVVRALRGATSRPYVIAIVLGLVLLLSFFSRGPREPSAPVHPTWCSSALATRGGGASVGALRVAARTSRSSQGVINKRSDKSSSGTGLQLEGGVDAYLDMLAANAARRVQERADWLGPDFYPDNVMWGGE